MKIIRDVKGFVLAGNPPKMGLATITVRWTSDTRGKTLSMSLADKILFTIPYEEIKDMVEERKDD